MRVCGLAVIMRTAMSNDGLADRERDLDDLHGRMDVSNTIPVMEQSMEMVIKKH